MRVHRRRWWRWLVGAGSGAMIVAGAVGLTAGPSAGAAAPGVGSSYAQSFQDTPHDGSLAVGVVMGEALAGHTNYVARAQAQGVDLGAIGLSLQGYNCGTAPSATQVALVPQPLQAETGEPGAEKGKTFNPTDGLSSLSPTSFPPSTGSTEHVVANGIPYGEADTAYGEIQGGAFTVDGMSSRAWSGLVNGQRVAAATSDIGSISLVNSTVVLKNMHWEVAFPTGGSGTPTGSFSIGQLLIGGTPVPGADASALMAAANKVLGTFGMELNMPQASLVQGVEFVTPLELRVVPNHNRDMIVDAIVTPGQHALFPVTHGLEDGFGPPEPAQLAQALCQSDTPITVADITIAGIDGAGYYSTAFGGVNASSGDAPVNNFDLTRFQPSSDAGSSQLVGAIAGVPGAPGLPGAPASSGSSGAVLGKTLGSGRRAPRVAAAVGHAASGPLLAIGLGGLLLLALLAEGDRRVLRRSDPVRSGNLEE